MKFLSFLSALALASFFSSAASAQVGRFEGGGTIYGFTNACLNAGWQSGPQSVQVRFHPDGLGTNGTTESISFIASTYAVGFALYEGSFSTSWQSVTSASVFSRPFYFSQGSEGAPDLQILSVYPRTLTETTAGPVRIRGMIRHFSGTRWCRINFDAVVQQRL